MSIRLLLSLMLVFAGAAAAHADEADAWSDARQMVVVTTSGWDTNHGTLRTYERAPDGWKEIGQPAAVTIGKAGAGWGLGLNAPRHDGPVKREGDLRSPAGVFDIGEAFGYAAKADTAMPYRALSASDWCVDVSGSPQYNRIVDAKAVGEKTVEGATEPMRRDIHVHGDQRYRQGFVIEHNVQQRAQGGSCIFAHLWKSPADPTTGCTAMAPPLMHRLLGWLRPEDDPVFVLLPQPVYATLQASWHLPALDGTAR
ncbi:L,D-transpeptidase family protein [Frateuria hangzhouensis]|uniref:L,D-transpeptidase family protein n=1 Tax=Frateuria hangzhouensis TaxID=2995589 RepID=UPI002260C0BE|nr:hypothetical protein [Frateuria sp. STR12]MCX7512831.1 hypothetical protein [Frateuria sp. STR12]